MPWRTFTDGAALILLAYLMAAAGFFGLTRDRLFFHSDLWSLALTLSFLAVLLAAVPIVLWFVVCRGWSGGAARGVKVLAAVTTWALLTAFPLALLAYAAIGMRVEWALSLIRSPVAFGASLVVFGAASAYPAFISASRLTYRGRTRDLATAFGIAIVACLVLGIPFNHWSRSQKAHSGALRVLVLLDGLPARYTRYFGWNAPETALDRVFAKATVYRSARSSAVWTFGWFGTLYSGTSAAVLKPLQRVNDADNLIARMQRRGTEVRWMAFHQNGIPESSAGHVSSYTGLRSSFLTPRYAWLPRLLGLDYDLVLPNAGLESLLVGGSARAAFTLLNPGWRHMKADSHVLLRELDDFAADADNGFLIFHTHWTTFAPRPPAASKSGTASSNGPTAELWAVEKQGQFSADHYYYPPDKAARVEAQRAELVPDFDALGTAIQNFLKALRARPYGDRVDVLFTADHGSAYEQGRRNYGYHPIEAVVQVPFFVYGHGPLSKCLGSVPPDGTPIDTRRLHQLLAQGVGAKCGAVDGYAATVTLRSDDRAEWYVVLARGNEVLRANIHPKSDGALTAFTRKGYDVQPLTLSPDEYRKAVAAVSAVLPAYGITKDEVNEIYSHGPG